MASGRSYNLPKLLKATYLAEGEGLLRETRATKLYYFPGPVLLIILTLLGDYGSTSIRYNLPAFPFLTSGFQWVAGYIPSLFLLLVFLFLTLIAFLWFVVRYFKWITNVYAITTNRVIIQSGILGRDFDEIPIQQVRGVDVHQSAGQRILRYGTVRVSAESGSSSSIGNEDWLGIPKPFEFQRLIVTAGQALSRGAVTSPPAATGR